jgi:hypothetical protein
MRLVPCENHAVNSEDEMSHLVHEIVNSIARVSHRLTEIRSQVEILTEERIERQSETILTRFTLASSSIDNAISALGVGNLAAVDSDLWGTDFELSVIENLLSDFGGDFKTTDMRVFCCERLTTK